MLRLLFAVAVLAVTSAVPAGGSTAGTPARATCDTALDGYEILPDTAANVPSFFFSGQLTVDRLLICDDGVFFFFHAREWGHYMQFILAWHKPTTERLARYYGRNNTDPAERAKEVLEATAVSLKKYTDYLEQLRVVLGRRYREGSYIPLDRDRHEAKLELSMGSPFEFTWRHRTASCQPLIDLYFVPTKQIPGWVVFLMLLPGHR